MVVAVIGINASDEELGPEVKLLLSPLENPHAAEWNLFVALAGFNAPSGASMIEAGQANIVEFDRTAELAPRDRAAGLEKAAQSQTLMFKGAVDFCQPLMRSCWAGGEQHANEINVLLEQNGELYRRYMQLHEIPVYYDTAQPSFVVLRGYVPGAVRSLFLSNVALRLKSAVTPQQRSAVLADLDSDLNMWRIVLTGHGSLTSKMMAIANLHGDLALLGDIIADRTIDITRHSEQIEAMLDRLVLDDWKIADIFSSEFRFSAMFYGQFREYPNIPLLISKPLDEEALWWESYWARVEHHFYKPNATLNLSARHTLEMQKAANGDPNHYLKRLNTLRRWRDENLALIGAIYNPLGTFFVASAWDVWDAYPLRAYDVAAFQRLVRLSYEIRKRGTNKKDAEAVIKEHPEWAVHPVSGTPFMCDLETHELVMEPLGSAPKGRRFRLPLSAARL
jgi:hypothetical protein